MKKRTKRLQKEHDMAERCPVKVPSFDVVQSERDRLIKKENNRKSLIRMCSILIVIAAIAIIAATKFFPVLQVTGSSMEPTLKDGEIVVVVKTDELKSGDVMAFYYDNKILIKRILGVSGEYINIGDDGTVFVNEEAIEEAYVTAPSLGECDIMLPCHVKDKEYFVMGDNRAISLDSRNSAIGCISKEQIVGKVVFRVWPFERVGNIR